MTDLVDRIDALIDPTCQQCDADLGGSVSDDFCSDACQQAWHEARSDPLVGYREPSDLPVHVYNQAESSSPEITPRFVVTHHPGADYTATIAAAQRHIQERIVAAVPVGTPPVTLDALQDVLRELGRQFRPRPSSWRLTQQQWNELYASIPLRPDGSHLPDGTRLEPTGPLYGIPIEIVDDVTDSMPYQDGWLTPSTGTVPPKPLFILAGNQREAAHIARYELRLPPLSWHYVHDTRDRRLLGAGDRYRFLAVGTFWERPDADDLYLYVSHVRHMTGASAADLAALAQRVPTSSVSEDYLAQLRSIPDGVRDRLINGRWR